MTPINGALPLKDCQGKGGSLSGKVT